MSVNEYQKNGKTFFKVYVQVRSKEIRRIRLQKLVTDIETLSAAQKEEKRLLKELVEKVAKLEGKGLLWSEIIYRWSVAGYNNQLNSRLHRLTINDHENRLLRYTKPWFPRIASDLTRGDGRQVLSWAETQGASKNLLKSIKTSINLVYNWGLEEGIIRGNSLANKSPVFGLGLDARDEKIKPILTLEEVRKLLLEAQIGYQG